MCTLPNLPERFAPVFDKSNFSVEDPLVKFRHSSKWRGVVFGPSKGTDSLSNLAFVGKIIEKSRSGPSFLGYNAWLDTTFPHVIYITGTRGSGKSFDLGVLVEGISELRTPSPIQYSLRPLTSIIIDTQSQFWTLAFEPRPHEPANIQQLNELNAWDIAPNSLSDVKLFVPPNAEHHVGNEQLLKIRPRDVHSDDWCSLLGQDVFSPQGHIVSTTLDALNGQNFNINDMISYIRNPSNFFNVAENSQNAILYKLESIRRTNLFSADGVQVKDFLKQGVCNVLLLRDISNENKSLITSVIARGVFKILGKYHSAKKSASFFQRSFSDEDLPDRVWLFIDEAHVVAPKDQYSPARDALVEYVKRGRDAGLSLVLATQQPSAVDDRILSQVNLTFSHRLSFNNDITSALNRIPTKSIRNMRYSGSTLTDFGDMMRILDSGECFLGDQVNSRVILTRIRPRVTAHGGYSPV